jgi:hypothetical protein
MLTRSGGVLRVTVTDTANFDGAGRISIHLRDAAAQFARGDFTAPQFSQGQPPPGTTVMRQMRNRITYTSHSIDGGAELIISSQDAKAVEAIHQFLEFER